MDKQKLASDTAFEILAEIDLQDLNFKPKATKKILEALDKFEKAWIDAINRPAGYDIYSEIKKEVRNQTIDECERALNKWMRNHADERDCIEVIVDLKSAERCVNDSPREPGKEGFKSPGTRIDTPRKKTDGDIKRGAERW